MSTVWAQTPPITSSGLNTQISAPTTVESTTQYDITGGTRPGGGTNLFHSFETFNVPSDTIANFLNETALPTTNILARVTGGQSSNIFGTLQTTGFGNANLFLMNPAGIVFGPSASLNVGGSVALTTADYLRLADNILFNAVPNAITDALLSTAPVAAYGFLGSNPGAIIVHGSQFTVNDGTGISLVGGNITIQSGTPDGGPAQPTQLSAPNGHINLAGSGSPGEISAVTFMPTSDMTMGAITLSQGTLLDVSANAAGTVRIRGGQLTIDQATISADTHNLDGSPTAIDIYATGNVTLANDLSPALAARTTGSGHAGAITIQSENLTASTSATDSLVALIDTHTSGTGTAGNVDIRTGHLLTTNGAFFIDTGTAGVGHGGNVSIQGTNVTIEGPNLATGNFRFGILQWENVSGSAGNLTIKASETLQIGPAAGLSTEAWYAEAGHITLQGRDINLIGNSSVGVDGDFGGAGITITADRLSLDSASSLNTNTVVDPGGDITINVRELIVTNTSQIWTATIGDGAAGDIVITASERLTLDGRDELSSPSAIVSNFFPDSSYFGGTGDSGSITITTSELNVLGGAIINTSTESQGNAGNISIAAHSVTISGQSLFDLPNTITEIGSTRGSGIYTRTVGTIGSDLCLMSCGHAGNITISTDFLKLSDGGTINSGTTNNGFGGNITLTADQSVTIHNGASVSAQSSGPGNAGDIRIDAGRQLTVDKSSITTEAGQASGGNIDIRAIDLVRLTNNGLISTSVLGGDGTGGNITIDPHAVILQSSQILAQAIQGSGGNITITTPVFLADQFSLVSASSQFGLDGTVTIQSPISNLSGTVGRLTAQTSLPQTLLHNRCVALAGGKQSSLVIAGRDAAPTDPGGWLSSPMMFAAIDRDKPTTDTATRTLKQGTSQAALLHGAKSASFSLRHLTPSGFLVRAFALDTSTGCHS
ncbi:MAG: filamentous hemagglutinin N-terminal domain-containing protein [Nitrospira sp.]|nr:filamentous hemagglutinin N-terminal domain-containing protein [Nitrospira sp.]